MEVKFYKLTLPETLPKLFNYLSLGEAAYSYSPSSMTPYSFYFVVHRHLHELANMGFKLVDKSNNFGFNAMNFIYSWNQVFKVHNIPENNESVTIKIRDYLEKRCSASDCVMPMGSVMILSELYGSSQRFLTLKRKAKKDLEEITGVRLVEKSVSNKVRNTLQWYV